MLVAVATVVSVVPVFSRSVSLYLSSEETDDISDSVGCPSVTVCSRLRASVGSVLSVFDVVGSGLCVSTGGQPV